MDLLFYFLFLLFFFCFCFYFLNDGLLFFILSLVLLYFFFCFLAKFFLSLIYFFFFLPLMFLMGVNFEVFNGFFYKKSVERKLLLGQTKLIKKFLKFNFFLLFSFSFNKNKRGIKNLFKFYIRFSLLPFVYLYCFLLLFLGENSIAIVHGVDQFSNVLEQFSKNPYDIYTRSGFLAFYDYSSSLHKNEQLFKNEVQKHVDSFKKLDPMFAVALEENFLFFEKQVKSLTPLLLKEGVDDESHTTPVVYPLAKQENSKNFSEIYYMEEDLDDLGLSKKIFNPNLAKCLETDWSITFSYLSNGQEVYKKGIPYFLSEDQKLEDSFFFKKDQENLILFKKLFLNLLSFLELRENQKEFSNFSFLFRPARISLEELELESNSFSGKFFSFFEKKEKNLLIRKSHNVVKLCPGCFQKNFVKTQAGAILWSKIKQDSGFFSGKALREHYYLLNESLSQIVGTKVQDNQFSEIINYPKNLFPYYVNIISVYDFLSKFYKWSLSEEKPLIWDIGRLYQQNFSHCEKIFFKLHSLYLLDVNNLPFNLVMLKNEKTLNYLYREDIEFPILTGEVSYAYSIIKSFLAEPVVMRESLEVIPSKKLTEDFGLNALASGLSIIQDQIDSSIKHGAKSYLEWNRTFSDELTLFRGVYNFFFVDHDVFFFLIKNYNYLHQIVSFTKTSARLQFNRIHGAWELLALNRVFKSGIFSVFLSLRQAGLDVTDLSFQLNFPKFDLNDNLVVTSNTVKKKPPLDVVTRDMWLLSFRRSIKPVGTLPYSFKLKNAMATYQFFFSISNNLKLKMPDVFLKGSLYFSGINLKQIAEQNSSFNDKTVIDVVKLFYIQLRDLFYFLSDFFFLGDNLKLEEITLDSCVKSRFFYEFLIESLFFQTFFTQLGNELQNLSFDILNDWRKVKINGYLLGFPTINSWKSFDDFSNFNVFPEFSQEDFCRLGLEKLLALFIEIEEFRQCFCTFPEGYATAELFSLLNSLENSNLLALENTVVDLNHFAFTKSNVDLFEDFLHSGFLLNFKGLCLDKPEIKLLPISDSKASFFSYIVYPFKSLSVVSLETTFSEKKNNFLTTFNVVEEGKNYEYLLKEIFFGKLTFNFLPSTSILPGNIRQTHPYGHLLGLCRYFFKNFLHKYRLSYSWEMFLPAGDAVPKGLLKNFLFSYNVYNDVAYSFKVALGFFYKNIIFSTDICFLKAVPLFRELFIVFDVVSAKDLQKFELFHKTVRNKLTALSFLFFSENFSGNVSSLANHQFFEELSSFLFTTIQFNILTPKLKDKLMSNIFCFESSFFLYKKLRHFFSVEKAFLDVYILLLGEDLGYTDGFFFYEHAFKTTFGFGFDYILKDFLKETRIIDKEITVEKIDKAESFVENLEIESTYTPPLKLTGTQLVFLKKFAKDLAFNYNLLREWLNSGTIFEKKEKFFLYDQSYCDTQEFLKFSEKLACSRYQVLFDWRAASQQTLANVTFSSTKLKTVYTESYLKNRFIKKLTSFLGLESYIRQRYLSIGGFSNHRSQFHNQYFVHNIPVNCIMDDKLLFEVDFDREKKDTFRFFVLFLIGFSAMGSEINPIYCSNKFFKSFYNVFGIGDYGSHWQTFYNQLTFMVKHYFDDFNFIPKALKQAIKNYIIELPISDGISVYSQFQVFQRLYRSEDFILHLPHTMHKKAPFIKIFHLFFSKGEHLFDINLQRKELKRFKPFLSNPSIYFFFFKKSISILKYLENLDFWVLNFMKVPNFCFWIKNDARYSYLTSLNLAEEVRKLPDYLWSWHFPWKKSCGNSLCSFGIRKANMRLHLTEAFQGYFFKNKLSLDRLSDWFFFFSNKKHSLECNFQEKIIKKVIKLTKKPISIKIPTMKSYYIFFNGRRHPWFSFEISNILVFYPSFWTYKTTKLTISDKDYLVSFLTYLYWEKLTTPSLQIREELIARSAHGSWRSVFEEKNLQLKKCYKSSFFCNYYDAKALWRVENNLIELFNVFNKWDNNFLFKVYNILLSLLKGWAIHSKDIQGKYGFEDYEDLILVAKVLNFNDKLIENFSLFTSYDFNTNCLLSYINEKAIEEFRGLSNICGAKWYNSFLFLRLFHLKFGFRTSFGPLWPYAQLNENGYGYLMFPQREQLRFKFYDIETIITTAQKNKIGEESFFFFLEKQNLSVNEKNMLIKYFNLNFEKLESYYKGC